MGCRGGAQRRFLPHFFVFCLRAQEEKRKIEESMKEEVERLRWLMPSRFVDAFAGFCWVLMFFFFLVVCFFFFSKNVFRPPAGTTIFFWT